tara:strand:+ start:806 stop:1324 length:519 start_codon:yes stop_codon:yes gene_type:complete
MSEKIVVPELGESITEATLAKWLKKKGESINADEALVELETDKVNLEVPSPVSGVVSEINFKDGDTVKVGEVLGLVSENNIGDKKVEKLKTNQKPKTTESENVVKLNKNKESEIEIFEEKLQDENQIDNEEPLVLTEEILDKNKKEEKILSPAVRKIVAEKKNQNRGNKRNW